MASWMLKAAAIAVLSVVPAGPRALQLARKHVTRSLHLSDRVARAKLARTSRHLRQFTAAQAQSPGSEPTTPLTVLELGTGWHPVAPVAAFLLGADDVFTVDVASHLAWPQVERTLFKLRSMVRRGELEVGAERAKQLDVALRRNDIDSALRDVGVQRFVGDAAQMTFPRPIDLFFSNNTLEHIPERVLHSLFDHFRQVGSPHAVMSHWIDMSDHFQSADPNIGPYHFLRFSSDTFRHINGPLHYQNRLRHSDYLRIHRTRGWHIAVDEPTRGHRAALRRIPVADEFARYEEDDLLVYETWTTSRRADRFHAPRAVPAPSAVAPTLTRLVWNQPSEYSRVV